MTLLVIFLIGIAEIISIGELHSVLGTLNLVLLYIVTTIIGAAFLLFQYPKYRPHINKLDNAEVSEDIKEKIEASTLSPREAAKLRHFAFSAVFYMACLLVAVPGIITDIIGILLVIPYISNYIIKKQINKTFKGFTAENE